MKMSKIYCLLTLTASCQSLNKFHLLLQWLVEKEPYVKKNKSKMGPKDQKPKKNVSKVPYEYNRKKVTHVTKAKVKSTCVISVILFFAVCNKNGKTYQSLTKIFHWRKNDCLQKRPVNYLKSRNNSTRKNRNR